MPLVIAAGAYRTRSNPPQERELLLRGYSPCLKEIASPRTARLAMTKGRDCVVALRAPRNDRCPLVIARGGTPPKQSPTGARASSEGVHPVREGDCVVTLRAPRNDKSLLANDRRQAARAQQRFGG